MTKPITRQLRAIMRKYIRNPEIWTNRYAKSRSVKCYSTGDTYTDGLMIHELTHCLQAANIPGTVRSGKPVPWRSVRSIIVSWPAT